MTEVNLVFAPPGSRDDAAKSQHRRDGAAEVRAGEGFREQSWLGDWLLTCMPKACPEKI